MIVNNEQQATVLSVSKFEETYLEQLIIQCLIDPTEKWEKVREYAKNRMIVLHPNTMEIVAYTGEDEEILSLRHQYVGKMSGVAKKVQRYRSEASQERPTEIKLVLARIWNND